MSDWQAWIGREDVRHDHVEPAAVTRWLATLDRAAPADGSVPQAYHWCLCLPDAPTAILGADGHPVREDSDDSFLPPIPLPRRMWAASKVEFIAPLRPGQSVMRSSRVASITEKQGGTGKLVFAEIAHETHGDGELAVREIQSIVFREPAPTGAPPAPPPASGNFDASDWNAHRMLVPSEALLFRYSALTFNGHRIHYDLPYATEVEGYRGLVVHGPLTATLLLDLAQRHFGDNKLKKFNFRGTSPAICGEDLHLTLRGTFDTIELGAFAGDGRQVMAATAAV
ncbi:MaoC family dehydratase N-terminal domain-containing protein [Sphingopyxis sp. BSN-002]|uniref:FAS1-like dehydratase domain-containing protein n=1 Tax=Sphingopyxis sp. BSN-002 TaxID=2911495 RepID=UPI001EDA0389|nr:MaoC family dehydratase N-terminal domain-containing protein [Sphingopyxis sp. BSN-002]UKK85740.1 MaoC family dehydratase N-terminal domain-containing protein [Sphingopyxis sp. BSN-002]